MNQNELRDTILASLVEVAPNVDIATLDPNTNYRDQFDFDSIDQLNYVLSLQKALGIEISELDYPQLAGLEATTIYLSAHLGN